MHPSRIATAFAGAVLLGAVGTVLTWSSRAPSAAVLPPVSATDLVASVHHAAPGPMSGTVRMDERLGLATVGAQPDPSSGVRTARVWSDGRGRRRISLPNNGGEHTIVNDGTTVWSWDSATRTVTTVRASAAAPSSPRRLARFQGGELMGNPVDAAAALLTMLAPSSVVRMDPADVVAGRPAYELVLDPLPTERTMLREVRVAVDGRTRVPLEVTVLANGSTDPALRIGFSTISFGPQDPALFSFTPPRGATVDSRQARFTSTPGAPAGPPRTRLVGQGWATVLVRHVEPDSPDGGPMLDRFSTPIHGPWGRGRLVSTAIGNAVITSDGRVAVGAVPAQVVTEALSR